MGRTAGSVNKTNYHYKVNKFNNNQKDELLGTEYFISQGELSDHYNISRTAIYHIIHENVHRVKKYSYLEKTSLTPPIPIYKNEIIQY